LTFQKKNIRIILHL